MAQQKSQLHSIVQEIYIRLKTTTYVTCSGKTGLMLQLVVRL